MLKNVTALFASYDCSGFQEAVANAYGEPAGDDIWKLFEQLLVESSHDMVNGHCSSFQIYDQDGNIVFQASSQKEMAA